mmetsp:Transcript_79933/g.226116  ORF Transcript_79933/g.226116 Transcript_79933/m.226116 type:complete len:214 (-) Transcript_79933:840-1481(-)
MVSLLGWCGAFLIWCSPEPWLLWRIHLLSDCIVLQCGLRVILVEFDHVCAVPVDFRDLAVIPTSVSGPYRTHWVAKLNLRKQENLFFGDRRFRAIFVPPEQERAVAAVFRDDGRVPAVLLVLGLHVVADRRGRCRGRGWGWGRGLGRARSLRGPGRGPGQLQVLAQALRVPLAGLGVKVVLAAHVRVEPRELREERLRRIHSGCRGPGGFGRA